MTPSPRSCLRLLLAGTLLCLLSACQSAVPSIPGYFADDPVTLRQAESLRESLLTVVDGGGNLGRLDAVRARLAAAGLAAQTRSEEIDWFTRQENLIVEFPGRSPEIIYIVAHYDKTDSGPLKFVSLLFNGALDEIISPTFLSDGAIDNGTGVAVVLELAAHLKAQQTHYYTYRILFAGAEESGLRGSRAHVAQLSDEERAAIRMAINIDTVGVDETANCVTVGVSDPGLIHYAMTAARKLNLPLERDPEPLASASDYLPFKESSTATDLARGLRYNFVGGVLPQRSWFGKPCSVPVINFSACDPYGPSLILNGDFFLPVGTLHGYNDRADKVSIRGLHEQFRIVAEMLTSLDQGAAAGVSYYRNIPHGDRP